MQRSYWLLFLFAALVLVAGSGKKSFVSGASRGWVSGVEGKGQDQSTKVLITGFEPFKNFKTNPSKEVALSLNNKCAKGLCFEGWSLPVTEAGVEIVEQELQGGNAYQWSLIIHLGLEDAAKGLKFEVAALNNKASDNTTAVPDGPMLLPSTVDLGLLDLKNNLGLSQHVHKVSSSREVWSRDAGTYYCNELYYRTLYAVRWGQIYPESHPGLLPVLFIHLPEASASITIQDMANVVAQVAYTAMNVN